MTEPTDEEIAREIAHQYEHCMALSLGPQLAADIASALRSARLTERERCAKVAETDKGVTDCPYGSDKPGDPTWSHTEADRCPVCRQTGLDDGSKCRGLARNRIAVAIRSRGQEAST